MPQFSVLPSKYQSQMTNPQFFQIAHRYCHFTLHAVKKIQINTPVELIMIGNRF